MRTTWERLKLAVQDASFIIGALLVVALAVMAVVGPGVAPHNPYVRDTIQWIDGELIRAPIPPGHVYPFGTDAFGRDNLSLLLYGAQQTLAMAVIATVARMLLGVALGTFAGWWPESWLDRITAALTEFLAAVPALITAMLLIYAIGVDRGRIAFIIGLSVAGISEIIQTVRGHVLAMRSEGYVEAARAVGLSPGQILSGHILPNLLPTLLSLSALQMGGVLLLLGELGFLGLFIGGGGQFFDLLRMQSGQFYIIPDWGAMLGTTWASFRALPWLPLVPAVAFFVSIVSFNLFGYGLQRFFERGRFYPSGWSVLQVLGVVAVALVGLRVLLNRSGLEAHYVDLAERFDVERTWIDLVYLTQEERDGRVTGTQGALHAAGYISTQFESAGLTPDPTGSYFQPYDAWVGQVITPPRLEVLSPNGDVLMTVTEGITFDPREPFAAVAMGEPREMSVVANLNRYPTSEGIAFLLDPLEDVTRGYSNFTQHTAVFRIVPDDQLPSSDRAPSLFRQNYRVHEVPYLLISESTAREIFSLAGLDLDELAAREQAGEMIELEPGLTLRLQVDVRYQERTAYNVVSYLPAAGVSGNGERILVVAPYTSTEPYGDRLYPGADENASGVAVMLEIARVLQDVEYQPMKTIVFAALDQAGGSEFMFRPILPADSSDTWTVIVIDGVGAGQDRLARVESSGGYAALFDQSARRFGERTVGLENYPFFFSSGFGRQSSVSNDTPYTGLAVTRPGNALSGTPQDTRNNLDPELIEEAGRVISHYLMVISS